MLNVEIKKKTIKKRYKKYDSTRINLPNRNPGDEVKITFYKANQNRL
jgi:hypothetical protein